MILGHRSPRLDLRGRKRCSYSRISHWPTPPFGQLIRSLSESALDYLDRFNSRIDHLAG